MPTPYPTKFKLPLEFLTLQDWNNFVQNLLFINQYGPGKLLQYYQNGNFQNLDEVIAKYLYVSALKVAGYNVLHNLSEPLAYTFGEGNQQPFKTMANRPTVAFPYSIPIKFVEFYPISKLPNYQFLVFPIEKLQVKLSQVSKQLQLLIPRLISKIATPTSIAGTQFQFSGTANLQTLIEDYLNPTYLQTWREIVIQNLGSSSVQINNAIYLMPKQCLKLTASSPSEVQLTAQTPTLLSEEIEFIGIPIVTYTITLTNSQSDPTPSPFQQLLNLNLSSILSSSSQLLNLQFCLDVQCQTPLYAWISQYNSNLSTVYIWVKLPVSIPANGSLTIYMFVRSSNQYPYTGMSPTLTSTYAQYDNGENVFTFYDNFAGTSLNTNKWITNGASYTINNGLTYTIPDNYNVLTSTVSFTSPYVIEYFGKGIASGGVFDGGIYFNIQGTGANENSYLWAQRNSANNTGQDAFYTYISGSYTEYTTWPYSIDGNMHVYTLMVGPNDDPLITERDYTIEENFTGMPSTYTSGYFGPRAATGTMFWQWVRVRAYPPNGVMPSNSQPQKTIVLIS